MSKLKSLNKIADIIIAFTCMFAIIMFVMVILGSTRYIMDIYKLTVESNAKLFWIGLLSAILYTVVHWVIEFINQFTISFKNIFQIEKKKRRFKHEQ